MIHVLVKIKNALMYTLKLLLCVVNAFNVISLFQLEHGARPCIKCKNGFFPINVAGKCASTKTLEVLIRHGEQIIYTERN